MSTPIDWYYSPDDGQQVGPLAFEQIRDLACPVWAQEALVYSDL